MATVDWDFSTSTYTTGFSSYDVFLNFRGEDTRNHFTAFLNLVMKDRGIDVFFDSEKLWIGEAIGSTLLGAIDGSKISIPVFSQGYANSKWCLLELAQIFHCYISNNQLVLPIFYDVEPSHVRNQTGSFEEAFREHEKNYEPQIVESWRKALKEIGSLKGEFIDKNKDQAKIVEAVVKRVLVELVSGTHLDECKFAVGMDSRIKDVLSLLSIDSNDVQFIGICGPCGIGKTTIVEAVYNHILPNFNRHSFISDVSKQAMQCMGLASLQKRLLKDVFKADFDINHYQRGKKLIKRMLCKEKVLLVLDDVESKEEIDGLASELNWFGQGSRVIITTRDEHILNVAKIEKDKIYWPRELDNKESHQLFSLHAFSMDEPSEDYLQLSHNVVRYSRGLPSTLEVLGSYLSDIRSKAEWRSTLRKLKSGKTSISSLASFRGSRKNTCRRKDNPLCWRPLLHNGNHNTLSRVSKVLGGCLDGSIATDRVDNKWFRTARVQSAISNFIGKIFNPNDSTSSDRVGNQIRIAEIRAATKNFDKSMMIGQGGFGEVYKGVLVDGTLAAFKRLSRQSRQVLVEFEREIELLSKLSDRHVVSMIGFCKEKNEMILVYEYMANGDLRKHLYGSDLPTLTWKQRLEICIGAARGLHYLHTSGDGSIIHRDVKPSNILLDENLVAKIADFGTLRAALKFDYIDASTTRIMGTLGYMAPEYAMHGYLTQYTDVYAFGVMLFEVLCARELMDTRKPEDQIYLTEWALKWQRRRSLETIVDPRLEGNYSPESLKKFGDIAEKCLQGTNLTITNSDQDPNSQFLSYWKNRPTMGEVLRDLEYVLQLHEAWLRDDAREKNSNCSSLIGTDGSKDSRNGIGIGIGIGLGSTLVRYDDSTGDEYSTCSSSSTIKIELVLVKSDDSTGVEYSTYSSLVGTVGCDEFSDVVNPRGELGRRTLFNQWIFQMLTFLQEFFHWIAEYVL
ncbi:uncharacterized protein LOC122064453 [Macadamia integrifolia]|uniref:uncharacterized protein LOC122064453 n=1 Tax=Macadamia integrifolia TaxID=60698 RepID=UPI001C4E9214|nr:uncharacterized protein LOC122064453 [Macadamia integrifolia]